MDVITLVVLLIGIVVAVGISAFLVSRMMQSYTREIYQVLESTIAESRSVAPVQTAPEVTEGANESELKLKTPQKTKVTKNEEELLEQLRSIINERMGKILDEAKEKKKRILTLLDFARGYALGYVTEDDYNAFLVKVLNELEEFKRLWLMKFPAKKDKEQLELMITYVSKTKLPLAIKTKDKGTIVLKHEEALIKMTEYINSAVSILDDLIEKRGGDPAVTPLEIRLSNEVRKLQEKVKKLEARLEELSAI
ncbi:hypothetical protein, conserved, containing leucine zipper motif [Thermococcus kodakarensis KOD1]|uniref:Uncharacterized protein n=2 Tax=Thermococcus TaxID=2263 RepID=Q5JF88_THEKO|nr:hypothetical protein, conserved, containing leucine zipper motif [Thermococcus kodakarensis KOD1]